MKTITPRLLALGFMVLAIIVGGGLYFKASVLQGAGEEHSGGALIGGAFTMTDHAGRTVTEKDLQGHYSLINFGFTSCPDVCPTTLAYMANLYGKLNHAQQKKLRMYFVTVDPARDTPDVLKNYLNAWPGLYTGLTGTPTQLAVMAKKYLVYYAKKSQGAGADYTMDHSAYIYIMGPDGQYISHFGHTTPEGEALAKIVQLLS